MLDKDKFEYRTTGPGAVEDLCFLAEKLGYQGWIQKLPLRNGAHATSLLNLLGSNPDLTKLMFDWILKNK